MEKFSVGDKVTFMFDGRMLNGTIIESISDSNFLVSFAIPEEGESYIKEFPSFSLTKVND